MHTHTYTLTHTHTRTHTHANTHTHVHTGCLGLFSLLEGASATQPHYPAAANWRSLNDFLLAHAPTITTSDLLTCLLHAHALINVHKRKGPHGLLPSQRFPLLLSQLLVSQPEPQQAALRRLLLAPSPWKAAATEREQRQGPREGRQAPAGWVGMSLRALLL